MGANQPSVPAKVVKRRTLIESIWNYMNSKDSDRPKAPDRNDLQEKYWDLIRRDNPDIVEGPENA